MLQKSNLNDTIVANNRKIQYLDDDYEIAVKSLNSMKEGLEMDIERLKHSIEMFNFEIEHKKKLIAG